MELAEALFPWRGSGMTSHREYRRSDDGERILNTMNDFMLVNALHHIPFFWPMW